MSRVLLILLAVGQVLAVAQAQPLDLDKLIADARSSNREIVAAQKRYEAARQRPRQAGSLAEADQLSFLKAVFMVQATEDRR